jgi:predicted ATPase
MLTTLAISNYRSLRNLIVPLQRLNLITGPNGSGKSSVYRALRLLAETAQGGVIPSLAREGGLQSTLWAGPEMLGRAVKRGEHKIEGTVRKERTNLRLGFAGDEFGYAIDLGLPSRDPSTSAFTLDPEIKTETIWAGPILRPAALLIDRHGSVVRSRGSDGGWEVLAYQLSSFDSMMTQFADPRNAPEMLALREQIRSWRFYDHFRTDVDAPARLPQIGTHTPVLSNDGSDMAAALQTILEIGDTQGLADAVADAFPGSSISVLNIEGRFEIAMHQKGLLRPLKAAELSDGTLRYLLWIAALLTPRPPGLLVLNEPETSLHPDLLPALGRLIANAADRSQVLVVTHAKKLIATLEEQKECNSVRLEKEFGETKIVGIEKLELPRWQWAAR